MMANRTREARGSLKLSRTLGQSPRHRLASLGNPKKKKVPCSFDFRGGGFFLKWKGHFSFWGSALQVFEQCGGASIRTRQNENLFFWGLDFRKTSADFPPAERGLGNECGRGFASDFFGGGYCEKLKSLVLWLYSRYI